jgi:hypothetical protein
MEYYCCCLELKWGEKEGWKQDFTVVFCFVLFCFVIVKLQCVVKLCQLLVAK